MNILDKADALFTDERGEAMFNKLIEAVRWSWEQMTFLSTVILIAIIAIIGLAWLAFSDRKKFMSKAYWRGFEDGLKKSNK